jgi:hypothetical protein
MQRKRGGRGEGREGRERKGRRGRKKRKGRGEEGREGKGEYRESLRPLTVHPLQKILRAPLTVTQKLNHHSAGQ